MPFGKKPTKLTWKNEYKITSKKLKKIKAIPMANKFSDYVSKVLKYLSFFFIAFFLYQFINIEIATSNLDKLA